MSKNKKFVEWLWRKVRIPYWIVQDVIEKAISEIKKFVEWLWRKVRIPYWIVQKVIGLRHYKVGDHVMVLVEGHYNNTGVIVDIDRDIFADFPIHVEFDEECRIENFTQEYYLPQELKKV